MLTDSLYSIYIQIYCLAHFASRRGDTEAPTDTDAKGEAALTSSLDEWDTIHGMDVVPGATAKRSRLKLVNKDGARKKARPSNYKIPKKLNPRSMGELSERFQAEQEQIPAGYRDDFQRYCDYMYEELEGSDFDLENSELLVGY